MPPEATRVAHYYRSAEYRAIGVGGRHPNESDDVQREGSKEREATGMRQTRNASHRQSVRTRNSPQNRDQKSSVYRRDKKWQFR
jgi:hypothetical protein